MLIEARGSGFPESQPVISILDPFQICFCTFRWVFSFLLGRWGTIFLELRVLTSKWKVCLIVATIFRDWNHFLTGYGQRLGSQEELAKVGGWDPRRNWLR